MNLTETSPKTETVIARVYRSMNRQQECRELVLTPSKEYWVAVDGGCQDARQSLRLEEAQEFWDDAAYKIGARPTV